MKLVLLSLTVAVLVLIWQRHIKKRGWQDSLHRATVMGIATPLAVFFGAFFWSVLTS